MDLKTTPNILVEALIQRFGKKGLCILDSCGADHAGSHRLFAAPSPCETLEITNADPHETLHRFDTILSGNKAAIFTFSYDLGNKLIGIEPIGGTTEPDLFVSTFDSLLVHDYREQRTWLAGHGHRTQAIADCLCEPAASPPGFRSVAGSVRSNFTRDDYLKGVVRISEHIRRGDTYQTNLTQQIKVEMPDGHDPAEILRRLRYQHPAPFLAYIQRSDSTVISASPERFFRVSGRHIETAPIKGTYPRGRTPAEDADHRAKLLASEKDRAENTMIVDLMRSDLGRVCEFGSVTVRELCALQTLPTLFHLVSTVEGQLHKNVKPSDILRALFPCGSITGAPKIRTMQIIDELEPDNRGLSMGAIGIYIPDGFGLPPVLDLSVAIRTMVIRDGVATFNVGGGVVIDSEPEAEYDESLLKASALLEALGGSVEGLREREQIWRDAV